MEFDSVKTKYLTSHSMGVGAIRDRVNKRYRGIVCGG